MICVLKTHVPQEKEEELIRWLKTQNLGVHVSRGEKQTVLGLIGDTSAVDADLIESLDIVEVVRRVSEPYKTASRQFHPADSVVDVGGVMVGEGLTFIAGPCSVETEEQVDDTCHILDADFAVKIDIATGGAYQSVGIQQMADNCSHILNANFSIMVHIAIEGIMVMLQNVLDASQRVNLAVTKVASVGAFGHP